MEWPLSINAVYLTINGRTVHRQDKLQSIEYMLILSQHLTNNVSNK